MKLISDEQIASLRDCITNLVVALDLQWLEEGGESGKAANNILDQLQPNVSAEQQMPEHVKNALMFSRNYAKASPYLSNTAITHIEGLCDLLEKAYSHPPTAVKSDQVAEDGSVSEQTDHFVGANKKVATEPAEQDEQESDAAMLNWLQEHAESGCITMCFEMDGGIHVTYDALGEGQIAAREVNTVRDGIQKLMRLYK